MTIVWVHTRPFTTLVPYSHLHITWSGSLVESFAECCKDWWFCECRNVSWRSTPDFAGWRFEILILILNDNESQLLNGEGIIRRELIYMREFYDHGRSFIFIPVWNVMEAKWSENLTIWSYQLGGRRPPRRVRAYKSTNNRELDNTLIEPHWDVCLVEFYG